MSETDPRKIVAPWGVQRYDAGSAERVEGVFSYLKQKWDTKFSEFNMVSHDHVWTVRCMSVLTIGEVVFMERLTERGAEKFAITHDWPKLTVLDDKGMQRVLASKDERLMLHNILDEIVVNDLAPMPQPKMTE